MQRERLVQYRGDTLVADTIEALRQLELRVAKLDNIELEISGPQRTAMSWDGLSIASGFTKQPPHTSMWITGREVCISLRFKEDPFADPNSKEAREVAALWGLVIPLGFTPWDRYPVVTETRRVFHYLGPWHQLHDHLLGEGRGEYGWTSVVAACQLDVGTWGGDKPTERFVQAQLHRIGLNPGPVDGMIQDRTLATIKAAGLHGMSMSELAKVLAEKQTIGPVRDDRTTGYVVIPNRKFSLAPFGGVKAVRTPTGAAITVDGPGRLVIDVEASL